MGFRFSKRVKILPGVSLNISKSGISTSIGPRGAKVNTGKRGTRATVGIPGTGVSYSEKISGPGTAPAASSTPQCAGLTFLQLLGIGVIVLFVVIWVFG